MTVHPVLQEAIEAATRALSDAAMSGTGDDLSWTDRKDGIAISLEGDTERIDCTAIDAAWEVFHGYLLEKLVDMYLDQRVAGVQEGWNRALDRAVDAVLNEVDEQRGTSWDSLHHAADICRKLKTETT